MERYPVRDRREGILAEGRVERVSGVAAARRGAEEGRRRPPSRRDRHAVAAVDHEPEHDHAARLDVAAARPRSPGSVRVRSRSVDGRCRRGARGRARPARSAGRARHCRPGSRPPARRAFTSSSRSTARRTSARWRGSRNARRRAVRAPRSRSLTQEFSKADRGAAGSTWTPGGTATAPRSRRRTRFVRSAARRSRRPARGRRWNAATCTRARSRCATCPSGCGGRRHVGRPAPPRPLAPAAARKAAPADRRRAGKGEVVSGGQPEDHVSVTRTAGARRGHFDQFVITRTAGEPSPPAAPGGRIMRKRPVIGSIV